MTLIHRLKTFFSRNHCPVCGNTVVDICKSDSAVVPPGEFWPVEANGKRYHRICFWREFDLRAKKAKAA